MTILKGMTTALVLLTTVSPVVAQELSLAGKTIGVTVIGDRP